MEGRGKPVFLKRLLEDLIFKLQAKEGLSGEGSSVVARNEYRQLIWLATGRELACAGPDESNFAGRSIVRTSMSAYKYGRGEAPADGFC